MEILLVEKDRLVRDQIKVGLQQFPEFSVTWGDGYAAINQLRQQHYDAVFLGLPSGLREAHHLIEHLRSFDRDTNLIAVVPEKIAKDIAADKSRFNISSIINTPLDVEQFFRLIARMRERDRVNQEVETQSRGAGANRGGAPR